MTRDLQGIVSATLASQNSSSANASSSYQP
jgi:hypothetical protein